MQLVDDKIRIGWSESADRITAWVEGEPEYWFAREVRSTEIAIGIATDIWGGVDELTGRRVSVLHSEAGVLVTAELRNGKDQRKPIFIRWHAR